MTSVFDGLAGALNQVFGAPVSLVGPLGVTDTIRAVFRQDPVEVETADGRMQVVQSPTLRVPRDLAAGIGREHRIVLADGREFRVLQVMTGPSPAIDGFSYCELELVR